MEKIQLIDKLISGLIVFISTIIVPNMISNFVDNNIFVYLITLIISLLLVIILYLLKHLLYNYTKNHLKKHYDTMRLYCISSSYWCDVFSNQNIHVKKCIILTRAYIDNIGVSKESYDHEISTAIERWKKLLHEGRISQLTIYSYNNIPDLYYCILDNTVVYSGLIHYDQLDSTGQYGIRKPQIFKSKSDNEVIQSYINQFDNYIKKYSSSIIYDSTK